jgi:hypothetical protein
METKTEITNFVKNNGKNGGKKIKKVLTFRLRGGIISV